MFSVRERKKIAETETAPEIDTTMKQIIILCTDEWLFLHITKPVPFLKLDTFFPFLLWFFLWNSAQMNWSSFFSLLCHFSYLTRLIIIMMLYRAKINVCDRESIEMSASWHDVNWEISKMKCLDILWRLKSVWKKICD